MPRLSFGANKQRKACALYDVLVNYEFTNKKLGLPDLWISYVEAAAAVPKNIMLQNEIDLLVKINRADPIEN